MKEALVSLAKGLGRYALLLSDVVKDLYRNGVNFKDLNRQVIRIGFDSLPIVMITAAFTGMVLALQTAYGLQRFGAKNYVGNIVSLSIIRELGPVLTALMLCGRVGAGITAEIASMVVTEQVDAMKTLGASPVQKLVTPRVVAGFFVLPMLTVFANLIGIFGGGMVAVFELGITAHVYFRSIMYTVYIKDVIDALVKSALFGVLLVSIACLRGLYSKGGTAGVGLSTTESVVQSSISIFVADYFITKLLIALG